MQHGLPDIGNIAGVSGNAPALRLILGDAQYMHDAVDDGDGVIDIAYGAVHEQTAAQARGDSAIARLVNQGQVACFEAIDDGPGRP